MICSPIMQTNENNEKKNWYWKRYQPGNVLPGIRHLETEPEENCYI